MKIQLCLGLLLMTLSLHSQTDFTGTWKLNVDKSQFNNTPGSPAAAKLVVEQSNAMITYQRNDRAKETLKIDSTASIEIVEGENKTNVSMKLAADKKDIIETRTYTYPESDRREQAARKMRIWKLSEDKMTLTIRDQIVCTKGHRYDMVLVYDRQ